MALFDKDRIMGNLKERGKFVISGRVDQEMFFLVRDFITYFESEADLSTGKYPDIEIKIDSPGGDYSKYGKNICILLNEYKGHITGIATANCSSMAFLILQSCDKRIAYENVRMVPHLVAYTDFHERLTSTTFKKLLDGNKKTRKALKARLKKLKQDDRDLCLFLSKKSNISEKKVMNVLKKDSPISAKKALKFGFIDEIIPVF